jgi:hypothetical protein
VLVQFRPPAELCRPPATKRPPPLCAPTRVSCAQQPRHDAASDVPTLLSRFGTAWPYDRRSLRCACFLPRRTRGRHRGGRPTAEPRKPLQGGARGPQGGRQCVISTKSASRCAYPKQRARGHGFSREGAPCRRRAVRAKAASERRITIAARARLGNGQSAAAMPPRTSPIAAFTNSRALTRWPPLFATAT